jgi:DNA polymerase-3 subunit alpha
MGENAHNNYADRKNARKPVEPIHPELSEPLQEILGDTYGLIVYQEQVMQIAQVLGGYSLGGADLLRRAMGKKKADEMALHRSIFREGAAKKQIATEQADAIFDLMEEFAGYGFNKSHAAAYSLLAYHTAWLKVHFPAEFFSANMTVEMDDTDKLKILFDDASEMGMKFEPPDINNGEFEFKPTAKFSIRYGLGAIKGTGKSAIEAICEVRNESGIFSSLFDFCVRIDRTKINRRTVDALIKAGAFDCICENRAELLASVGLAFEFAQSQEINTNQSGLFDNADTHGSGNSAPEMISQQPWGIREKLTFEKSAVGFHLSGHLFDEYKFEIRKFIKHQLSDLTESREPQWVAGIVRNERSIPTAKGKLNIFVLDDCSSSVEITVDEAVLTRLRPLIQEDQLIFCLIKILHDRRTGGLRMALVDALDLPTSRCLFGKYLKISITENEINNSKVFHPTMSELLASSHVKTPNLPVRVHLFIKQSQVELQLGENWNIYPTNELISALLKHDSIEDSLILYE